MEHGIHIKINVPAIQVGPDRIVPNVMGMDIIGILILRNVVVIPDGMAVIVP